MNSPSLVSMFADRVSSDGNRPALWVKRGAAFAALTWSEVARDVRRASAALVRLGVQPGDRVVQLAENRYEWIVADLAIQFAQAIHVPIHAPLTGEQISVQIAHCAPRVVLVSSADQARKLASCADRLPADTRYCSYDDCSVVIGDQPVDSFTTLRDEASANDGAALEAQAIRELRPDSIATILYTSGTTGEPKGVMLTQSNLVSNTEASVAAFDHSADDLRLNFLPLSHIFARTCDLYCWIASGTQLALAQSRDTVLDDCAAVHPTWLNGVPYFFDKVVRLLHELKRDESPEALREILGGRIRICCAGGAALPDAVFDYFTARNVALLQGYGLTESSPVITLSTPQQVRRGCVGRTIPGVEVKIAGDGEILTRGPHVMLGYYKNPAATDEVLRDGWLYTGDIGELDADGFLRITGRKKELIVTSGGKNIAPVYLESLLTQDPLILQALVVGDARSYLTALIVPNPDVLHAEIVAHKIFALTKAQVLRHPRVLALYEERIRERLKSVSPFEQVRKFTLLDRGFTIESGELTPKLTLRRKVIEANFAAKIEAMYRTSD